YPAEVEGRSLDAWIKDIEHYDPSVREHAIRTVLYFGPASKKAVPALIRQAKMLNDFSPQSLAVYDLGVIVPTMTKDTDKSQVKEAVDALNYMLESSQAIIRLRAAMALAAIGPPARV